MESIKLLFSKGNELISEITFYKLTDEGYEVLHHTKENSILKEVTTYDPTLIVLEMNLPNIIGYEVSKVIKNNEKKAQVIMIKN